jgi:hypothetical protein
MIQPIEVYGDGGEQRIIIYEDLVGVLRVEAKENFSESIEARISNLEEVDKLISALTAYKESKVVKETETEDTQGAK